MGPQRHVTGAFTVLMNGMPATRLTSVSIGNGAGGVTAGSRSVGSWRACSKVCASTCVSSLVSTVIVRS